MECERGGAFRESKVLLGGVSYPQALKTSLFHGFCTESDSRVIKQMSQGAHSNNLVCKESLGEVQVL